jgi:hypothetical protein
MINTEQIVAMIKESTDYEEKYQAVSLIIASIKSKKLRLNKKTRLIMASFAVSEMGTIISAAEKAPCYRIKSNIFHYADILFGLIMATHKTRADFTQESLSLLNEVSSYMKNEARIEDRIDTIFSQDIISVSDVDALLEELSGKRSNLVLQALACRENAVRETACRIFDQKKYIPLNSEASLLGAAIIGFSAMGEYSDIKSASAVMIKKQECVAEPASVVRSQYDKFLKFAQVLDSICENI